MWVMSGVEAEAASKDGSEASQTEFPGCRHMKNCCLYSIRFMNLYRWSYTCDEIMHFFYNGGIRLVQITVFVLLSSLFLSNCVLSFHAI